MISENILIAKYRITNVWNIVCLKMLLLLHQLTLLKTDFINTGLQRNLSITGKQKQQEPEAGVKFFS